MMSHDILKNVWKLVMVMFSCCFQGMAAKQKADPQLEDLFEGAQAKNVS